MNERVSNVVAELIGRREMLAEKIGGRRHEMFLQPGEFLSDARRLLRDAAIAGALGDVARVTYRNTMVQLAACCVAAAEVEDARSRRSEIEAMAIAVGAPITADESRRRLRRHVENAVREGLAEAVKQTGGRPR